MADRSLDASFEVTDRTRIKRLPERANYDRELVHSILDAAYICHVGYVFAGMPHVTPTAHWREEDHIYWHGSSASRMLRAQQTGIPVCVTVTHLDGLVLARSAFHHSMNYRSVMALGSASVVHDPDEKMAALRSFTERLVPCRWREVRHPTAQEIKATIVMRMRLEEVSAKVRAGPPIDDDDDYASPFWAGVVPISMHLGAPIPDPKLSASVRLPAALS
jgi:nitroimidazol reductase NimA-like FMN-containing flavoprotein (pyridoxamine 5'-phosphate oxidase superfamily)